MSELLLKYLADEFTSLDELYTNPWTCQAIFRTLPPLAKQYIMRLLYIGAKEFSRHTLSKWAVSSDEMKLQHTMAIQRMEDLHLLLRADREVESRRSKRKSMRTFLRLNPIFQEQMKNAVANSSASPWSSTNIQPDKNPPTGDMLETFSRRQWESILSKLLGGKIDSTVIKLYASVGLMQETPKGWVILSRGYQFLFQDPLEQIWMLLQAHLRESEHKIELLTFLFQLSFLSVGKDYEMALLSEPQRAFVKLLSKFGLIYRSARGSRRYYPTQLAVNLMSQGTIMKQEGYIVAETNHQVYSYCQSILKIKLLSLIIEMRLRLPNLVVGKVTRRSICDAFKKGLTAQQIIDFLEQNAHFESRKSEFSIPETLIHQIQLWEKEEKAVDRSEGVLFERFSSNEEYETLKQFAAGLNVLIWHSDASKLFFIAKPGVPFLEEELYRLSK